MLVTNINHLVILLIELVVIYFLYSKAAKVYEAVKMMEIGLQYEH
jgi:hypothetical protein